MFVRQSEVGEIPDLWAAVYELVSQVPPGMVTTYGHVARALGDIMASRFVGLAMSLNEDVVRVPCRRVVQADGRLGGYTGGGPERKAALLIAEGIQVRDGRVQDLERYLFSEFVTDEPLKRLGQRQKRLKRSVRIPSKDIDIRYVAGVDVAYSGEHAYSAAAVFDYRNREMVDSIVREGDAKFPYIPTYLAFRELPIVSALRKSLPDETVMMYDGNGLLHPGGMGIATHAGVVFGLPTIGVAKSLLCGVRGRARKTGVIPISVNGKVAGFELRGRGASKPVYVSAGHGISAGQALAVARWFMDHRVPEPTRMAHVLAERARREASHK